jgi:hypothetical protein
MVKIYAYKNLAMFTIVLVMNAFISTHLVAYFIATKMYLFHVGLIGPIKSRPHFIKGSYGSVIISLARLFMFNPPILW